MNHSVAALVATHGRPRELSRLLDSLAEILQGVALVLVVDNASSAEARRVVEAARCPARYIDAGRNLGCGGGLQLAGQNAEQSTAAGFTHYLVLDDDAVLAPDTINILAAALESTGADLAYPLVVDGRGHVGWVPGVVGAGRAMERAGDLSPEQFRAQFGAEPRDLIWAQGICLLVTRCAIEAHGWHRDDFWVRGEDLEFSLRLTAHARGIFVPAAVVEHLPPEPAAAVAREAEYLRHCALLQNMAYISFRLSHGRRIAWTVAGGLRRFFRLWSWRASGDAIRALWRGAVRAEPAGRGSGLTFRERCAALTDSSR